VAKKFLGRIGIVINVTKSMNRTFSIRLSGIYICKMRRSGVEA
jgi:hypothetical protein